MYSQGLIEHAWLELTNRCNLECQHCYTNSSPRSIDSNPLDYSELCSILKNLTESGCRSIQFIGGEPTTHPQFCELLDIAVLLGFEHISVYTNVYSLREKHIAALSPPSIEVATSFYSAKRDLHDLIVGKVGAFEKTTQNIKKLTALGKAVSVGIVHIPGQNDNVEETVAFLKSLGVIKIAVDKARHIGRHASGIGFGGKENDELCGRCANGSVCITPSGDLHPCIMSRHITVGNVRESPLNSAAMADSLRAARIHLEKSFSERGKLVQAGCSPEDNCNPGACHPQVGGPPTCMPQNSCAPSVYGD
jgi:MoaA/NifB/PqqE/SkfB family radical SAM enzyme